MGVKKSILKFANVLAIVLHPLFLFFYGYLIIALGEYKEIKSDAFLLMGLGFLLAVLIPIVSSYFLTKDLFLKERHKRYLPLLITLVSYGLLLFLQEILSSENTIGILRLYTIIGAVNVLFLLLITLKYKISLHSNAFGIWTALLFVFLSVAFAFEVESLALYYVVSFVLLTAFSLVIWQRFVSGAHSWLQIISGYMLGFILTIIIIRYESPINMIFHKFFQT